ncbi:MAG: murein biosynthesis integral membrane protein MurJ [Solirubrobacterales bacterium]
MSDYTTVAKATVFLAALAVVAKVLGFIREMVLAYVFGANATVDAYVVALTLPMVVFAVVGAALSVTAVPIFADYAARGEKPEAFRMFSHFTIVLALLLFLLVLALYPAASRIILLIAPELQPDTAILAAKLLRIMLPGLVFFSLANLFYGILNANQVFGPPAVGPAVISLLTIAGTFCGIRFGIQGAAWGTLVGFAGAMLLQLPFLSRAGFRLHWPIELRNPGVRKTFAVMLPMMVGSSIVQFYVLIDRFFASGLPAGSISALNYASKVILLPQAIIVLALGTAIFPMLSDLSAQGRESAFSQAVDRSLKLMTLIALPCGVALAFLRKPIIAFLFQRGAFDQDAVSLTAFALLCFSVGLVGHCLEPILTRSFYAMQDTGTPVKIAVFSVLVNLLLSMMLVRPFQLGGLALANSAAAILNVTILYTVLTRRVDTMRHNRLGGFFGQTVAASLAAGAAAWILDAMLAPLLPAGTLRLLVRLSLDGVAGAAVFGLICRVLKLDEYMFLRAALVGHIRTKASAEPEYSHSQEEDLPAFVRR